MPLLLVCMFSIGHAEPAWTPIFNGQSLDGWTPKIAGRPLGENYLDTFRVRDGVLAVDYSNYKTFDNKFGHLFYKDKLSHYSIRIEYRFVGEQCPGAPAWALRNSGLMFHAQDPKSMPQDQKFPVSIEAQFFGGLGKGKRPTANMCSPGTHVVLNGKLYKTHCADSKSKTYDGDQWVTVEIQVNGSGTVRHIIDREVVLEYEQPQYDPEDKDAKPLLPKDGNLLINEGFIALQAESHPIEFRKIELQKREPQKPRP